MLPVKVLKVIPYADYVAIEYELVEPEVDGYQPHHPQTFSVSWDSLRLSLPKDATEEDCIALAALRLREAHEAQNEDEQKVRYAVDIAAEALKEQN